MELGSQATTAEKETGEVRQRRAVPLAVAEPTVAKRIEPVVAKSWQGTLASFRPLRGLKSAHAQTILGPYLSSPQISGTIKHRLELPDGDSLTVHEDAPRRDVRTPQDARGVLPSTDDVVILSLHGLGGCHQSSYVRRLAWESTHRGWHSYRMDMRGAGDSGLESRFLYHAGRSDDVLCVLRYLRGKHPQATILLVGYSLGGAITLHLLSNLSSEASGLLQGAIAVCPPLDLAACSENIRTGFNKIYDRTFAKILWQCLLKRENAIRELGARMPMTRPASLLEFDHQVTAPLGGYASAQAYYEMFSTLHQVNRITLPTLVIMSADDPLIPLHTSGAARWSPTTKLVVSEHGGHLGFIGRSSDGSRYPTVRWLEHAIVESIEAHLR